MGATKQVERRNAQVIDLTKAQNGGIKKRQWPVTARAIHEHSEEEDDEDDDGEDGSLGPESEDEENEELEEYKVGSKYEDESGFQRVRLPQMPRGVHLIEQKVYVARSTHDSEMGSEDTIIGIYDHPDDANEAAQAWLFRQWGDDLWESYEEHLASNGTFRASATGGENESWEICVESEVLTIRIPDQKGTKRM